MTPSTQFWDELAIESYKAILKKRADHPLIHHNLGLAYIRVNKINKAIRSFQRAIKLDKEYADAYYHLGNAYQTAGKALEAARSFKKYLKFSKGAPKDPPVVENLLENLYAMNETENTDL
ncbi:MAG: hypothetical protein CMO81_04265 [Waddliaceae bacterium]|nr:hypothetical protein [Waddliaceae bacterium]